MQNTAQEVLGNISAKIIDKFLPKLPVGRWQLAGKNISRPLYTNVDRLVEDHFLNYSASDHICRVTLDLALRELYTGDKRQVRILETGSSAWGTNSSLLFDSFVNSFGGQFETVDIRISPSVDLATKCSPNTRLYTDDSVSFLKKWSANNPDAVIDLLYLFALNTPADLSYFKSAQGDIDNFSKYQRETGLFPGKGSLLREILKGTGRATELKHAYQSLWKF